MVERGVAKGLVYDFKNARRGTKIYRVMARLADGDRCHFKRVYGRKASIPWRI